METPEVNPDVTPQPAPDPQPVAEPAATTPETLSVPDVVANAALALTAITELAHRAHELYTQFDGINAAARADLAFVLAVLNTAKAKL